MAKNRTLVKDVQVGKDLDDSIVVEVMNPEMRKTGQGKDFFQMTGRDSSGTVVFKVWQPHKLPDGGYAEKEELKSGTIIRCEVREVIEWNSQIQIKSFDYRVIPLDDPQYEKYQDMVRFGPSTKELDGAIERVRRMVSEISDPKLNKMCLGFLDSNKARIKSCPASPHEAGHHGYAGGYLKHVEGVMRLARVHAKMIEGYASLDVVVAGAFFHDIGKLTAYAERGLARTRSGRLLGHIALGLPVVNSLCDEHGVDEETAMMILHIVTSHHGKKEYGSPEEPHTIEAEIVCWADMADSRVEAVRMKLQNGLPAGDFVGTAKYGVHTAYLPPANT